MTELLSWIAILGLGTQALIGLAYWISSVTERETRASVLAALQFLAMLVPLAVDAGLGQVGRLGYLMTAKFGPRVRLGAVTTDMELLPDKPVEMNKLPLRSVKGYAGGYPINYLHEKER